MLVVGFQLVEGGARLGILQMLVEFKVSLGKDEPDEKLMIIIMGSI